MVHVAGDPNFIAWANGVDTSVAAKIDTTTARGTYLTFAAPPQVGALTAASTTAQAANVDAPAVLQSWYAALANRANSRCNVVVIGDSITEGEGSTAVGRRWVDRLAASLRARYGLSTGGAGYIHADDTGSTTYTYPGVRVGGALNNDYSPKRKATNWTSAGSATFTVTGTAVDLLWVRGGGGTFSYAVDGGSATNVSTSGGVLDGMKTRVSLGAAGAHTVVVSWVSGNVFFDGLIVYNGDESAGIMVHDCGQYGITSAGWAAPAYDVYQWPAAIAALNPDVILVALGSNDVMSLTPAQFKTNVTTLLTKLRAATGFPTVPPPIVLVPYGARQGYQSQWASMVTGMYELAATDSKMLVCDLTLRIPDYDDTPSLSTYYDGVHPNDKGHAFIADSVAQFLLP